MMRPIVVTLASVLPAMLSGACTKCLQAQSLELIEHHGDWTIEGNQTLRRQHIRLDGNLILPAGTTLTLEDCKLEILGTYSREHSVEWNGGTLVTRRSTLGGFVNDAGIPIHTVFHLYDGLWEASDTIVQYSYGISFHWKEGHGVLQATRLKAGPRPDAIILSGQADVTLVDCDFPIGLGLYVQEGGTVALDLRTDQPLTATYDRSTTLPGVEWQLKMQNTRVGRWFLFLRQIGMQNKPAEVTLVRSQDLIVSLLGHNLKGSVRLSRTLSEPLAIGNVTLKTAGEPADIDVYAVYLSGEENDLMITGETLICELMHRGGKLRVFSLPGSEPLRIGCTTLELSGNARLEVERVVLGQIHRSGVGRSMGEANITGNAVLSGTDVTVSNLRFRTLDDGQVRLSRVKQLGKIEKLEGGGPVVLSP